MVSETKAPTGYIKDETPKNIVVRSGVANSLIFDDDIAGGGLGLLDYHRAGDAADPNFSLVIGGVEAIGGQVAKNIVVRSGVANSLIFDDEPATTLIIRKFIEGTENEPLSGVAFKRR